MALLSRRLFLRGAGGLTASAASLGSYAFAIEPGWRLGVTRYTLTPPRWPAGLSLKVGVVADIHACRPFMGPEHIRTIVELTNGLRPDIIVLLGDYNGAHRYVSGPVMPEEWAAELAALKAPLGVYSVLGNHDFWHGPLPNLEGDEGESVRRALKSWLAGLGDQMAHHPSRGVFIGIDDLPGTLRQVTDSAPVLLLAHEPAIFRRMDPRVSLTLCGHTHGGQVYIPGLGTPAITRERGYVYGHIVENGQHMVISGGLGTSIIPVRFLRPPEVVEVVLGGAPGVV
jgi:uncharacterized protein